MKLVTEILNTKYPLIQAPMSWVTNAELVAAVSNAGGMGVLGPNAGQKKVTTDSKETAERMRQEINKVRHLTNKSFGLNILTPSPKQKVSDVPFTRDLLAMAFAENIKYYVVVGSAHKELFDLIHQNEGIVVFRPLTPTIEQMRLGEKYGADIEVATGSDEGGVIPNQDFGTFTVVPTMVDTVEIPVLAAGGINDKRGVKAALALGAQGVYVGSRFLVTKESPMSSEAKTLVKNSNFNNLMRVSPTQRSLSTNQARNLADLMQSGSTVNLDRMISQNGGLRPGMLEGDFQHGIISVNNGVGLIDSEPTVAQLVESLMS